MCVLQLAINIYTHLPFLHFFQHFLPFLFSCFGVVSEVRKVGLKLILPQNYLRESRALIPPNFVLSIRLAEYLTVPVRQLLKSHKETPCQLICPCDLLILYSS